MTENEVKAPPPKNAFVEEQQQQQQIQNLNVTEVNCLLTLALETVYIFNCTFIYQRFWMRERETPLNDDD